MPLGMYSSSSRTRIDDRRARFRAACSGHQQQQYAAAHERSDKVFMVILLCIIDNITILVPWQGWKRPKREIEGLGGSLSTGSHRPLCHTRFRTPSRTPAHGPIGNGDVPAIPDDVSCSPGGELPAETFRPAMLPRPFPIALPLLSFRPRLYSGHKRNDRADRLRRR
jgi:hypothetical protein